MLKDLRKHLEGKGVDPSVLDDYSVESSVDEANAVEADALTQALDALTKAMQPRDEEEMMIEDDEEMMSEDDQRSLFDLDDEELDLEDDEDLDVEKAYYRDAMKALADNTDQMIAEMNKRMDAVLKGVEAMVSEMKGMKGMSEDMEKSLNALRGQPLAPRAVTSAPVNSAPETPAAPQRGDVIRKGLKMLQDSSIDAQRKSAVRTAITQLEAGIPVSAISHIIDLD
jgi:DNA repair ATPase RecN